jgi:OOP family OmpA-OmpF porin
MAALSGLAGAAAAEMVPATDATPAPRQFVIFFDHGGAWIPEDAQAVLPQVAEIYKRAGYGAIAIACFSDNIGTQDLNLTLTQDRADRIKGDLVIYGVPQDKIAAVGKGFADPLVPDAALDVAVSNRRCTIDLS